MGLAKSKKPTLAPEYLKGREATPIGSGGGSVPAYAHPAAPVISDVTFYNGNIYAGRGLNPSLQTGATDGPGYSGIDGSTETRYLCNVVYDITPTASQFRGYSVTLPLSVPQYQMVEYFGTHLRVDRKASQSFGLGPTQGFPDPLTTNTAYRQIMFSIKSGQANWQAHIFDGTTHYEVDTGIAWAADDWHTFEILIDYGDVPTALFYIDGVLVATITQADATFPAKTDSADLWVGSTYESPGLPGTDFQVFFISSWAFVARTAADWV